MTSKATLEPEDHADYQASGRRAPLGESSPYVAIVCAPESGWVGRLLDLLQVETLHQVVLRLDVMVPKTPAGLWKTTGRVEVQPDAAVLGWF